MVQCNSKLKLMIKGQFMQLQITSYLNDNFIIGNREQAAP